MGYIVSVVARACTQFISDESEATDWSSLTLSVLEVVGVLGKGLAPGQDLDCLCGVTCEVGLELNGFRPVIHKRVAFLFVNLLCVRFNAEGFVAFTHIDCIIPKVHHKACYT